MDKLIIGCEVRRSKKRSKCLFLEQFQEIVLDYFLENFNFILVVKIFKNSDICIFIED
ncbi:unnamed protein product [Tenebrio molitor]|nr:unnamed protein product [Tenebrio molitor]